MPKKNRVVLPLSLFAYLYSSLLDLQLQSTVSHRLLHIRFFILKSPTLRFSIAFVSASSSFSSAVVGDFLFPRMNPHSTLLWPESLGPRPDGIGPVPTSNDAGAPRFPSSDYAPYAFGSGSPCGERYDLRDADSPFYYYGRTPCDGDQSIDPWLVALMEDLRELYVRRRQTFQQLFPKLHDEIDRKLEDALRSKRTREVRAFPRSLSVGSPRLPGRDGGVGDEPALRLDRFKVRTVDLEDDVAESGGQQGGKGGVASGGSGGRKGGK